MSDDRAAQAVIARLFRFAAKRAGSSSALGRDLGLTDGELHRYLGGGGVPPEQVLLRTLDWVIGARFVKRIPGQVWRSLLLRGKS